MNRLLWFLPLLLLAATGLPQSGGGGGRWSEPTRTRAPTWTPVSTMTQGPTSTPAPATATPFPAAVPTAVPTATPVPATSTPLPATSTTAPTLPPVPTQTPSSAPNETTYMGVTLRYTDPGWLIYPQSGLDHLYNAGGGWLQYVQRYLWVIEQHRPGDCGGASAAYMNVFTRTMWDCSNGMTMGSGYASLIVHEATHSRYYWGGMVYLGCVGEARAYAVQRAYLDVVAPGQTIPNQEMLGC